MAPALDANRRVRMRQIFRTKRAPLRLPKQDAETAAELHDAMAENTGESSAPLIGPEQDTATTPEVHDASIIHPTGPYTSDWKSKPLPWDSYQTYTWMPIERQHSHIAIQTEDGSSDDQGLGHDYEAN
ncbi:hypothetical protein AYO20_08434 [Fonsecaea nubica]|uniref:Uncharacterized protein n=1 Tax=Fonsecaea nubica TaxID=856822 RepID=A0A178CPJ3_9EURO|nr:hypothetical protein AYO20_08434 [Fonsecaea nubica]OAL31103.1 hypothetical protein AYO20_08434 [Fonsecaea nubica]